MDTQAPAPLPCPFCGGTNLRIEDDEMLPIYVICEFCDALGPDGKTTEAAIAAWNKRDDMNAALAESRQRIEALEAVEVEDMPQAVMTPERVAALKHVVVAASYGYLEGWDGPGVRDAIEQWSRLQSELEGNNATV